MSDIPKRLRQVAITVSDRERAKAFYGETLGLTHLFDAPPALAFFQCGETRLMLSAGEGPGPSDSTVLYYEVDDVAATHKRLAAAGIAFEEAPRLIATVEGRDLWLALCRDSEGNLLGLING